jgi:aspartate aminotransferase
MLSKNVRNIQESFTLKINATCRRLTSEGIKVYNLGLGQSPFPPPKRVVEALQCNADQNGYLPTTGLPALKEQIKKFYKSKHEIDIDADQILIGPGSKELLLHLQLAIEHDVILVSPCWVSYGPQARLFGKTVHVLDTSSEDLWKVTPAALDELCNKIDRPKMMIFNSANNPTGQVYSTDELKALGAIVEKHDILVVSDEIYALLTFDGGFESLYKYCSEHTIISSGLSKWCAAGGWRLGTFVFPKRFKHLQKAMTAIASESYSAVCAPVQHAAVVAYAGDFDKRYLPSVKKILSALNFHCADKLSRAGLVTAPADGGFYLFVDFSAYRGKLSEKDIATSVDLCTSLLEEASVAAVPGIACERKEDELSVRLAIVNFDGKRALDFVKEYEGPLNNKVIERYCGETIAAIDAIVSWVESL